MATSTEPTIYNEVFVSYSRKNGVFAQKIVKAIYDSGRENIWIDWEDIEYAEDWWQKILAGIDSADNFIFILTPDSAQSQVCFNEVDYAVKSGKRIIPIDHIAITEQSDLEKMHPNISVHNWLPFKDDDDFDEGMKRLVKTLETDLKHVKLHTRFLVRARDWEIGDRDASFLLTGAEIDSAETWLAEADKQNKIPEVTGLHRDYITAGRERHLAEKKRLRNLRWTGIVAGIIAVIAIVATIVAGFLAVDANNKIAELEHIASGATEGAFYREVLPVIAEVLIDRGHPVKLLDCEGEFCIEMVFVPAGCFMMGSNEDIKEQPIHEVCIEEDFWIDKYEVTNDQFESLGGEAEDQLDWDDPMQPSSSTTWFEALAFCELRGGSLPTEAQWEYAARGPDNLVYPWGNNFVEDNVINQGRFPLIVGSRPQNVSWVGAYDMSGNTVEWTSTIYGYTTTPPSNSFTEDGDYLFNYPYDGTDGREEFSEDPGFCRVVRSRTPDYYYTEPDREAYRQDILRSAYRSCGIPDENYSNTGFRCVVSVPVP